MGQTGRTPLQLNSEATRHENVKFYLMWPDPMAQSLIKPCKSCTGPGSSAMLKDPSQQIRFLSANLYRSLASAVN